jgi:hypothetical protein
MFERPNGVLKNEIIVTLSTRLPSWNYLGRQEVEA